MQKDVLFTVENQVGVITLNRPKALNALTYPMIINIQKQLQAWVKDTAVKAVMIKSDSPKVFCAGGDVRWLYEAGEGNHHEQMQFFWHEYRLNHFISQYPKPYIALLDGLTMGGGVGVSLHGHHRIASARFSFAMPETGIGFFPDIGASYLLSRLPHHLGLYLGLTGNRITADEAYFAGLVDYRIESSSVMDVYHALIKADFSKDPHETVKSCLKPFQLVKVDMQDLALPINDIEACFSAESIETVMDKLDTLSSPWATEVLATLSQKSPKSLKITFYQLRKAMSMTLADCLRMDYALVYHFMQDHDFYEGVRALLVDKDKSPQWNENSVERVNEYELRQYFVAGDAPLELLLHA